MVLVDTNVLIDVIEDNAWADWSIGQLSAHSTVHVLAIDPVTYAELAPAFKEPAALDRILSSMRVEIAQPPRAALFLAGKAFVRYRREGGVKTGVLADFFIGAHAAVLSVPLLTRDTARYTTYFPTVKLVRPGQAS